MHCDEISRVLNLQPRFSKDVGAPRVKSDGTESGGVNEQTYWSSRIETNESDSLVEALNTSLADLEVHRDFLRKFAASGGEIEYFIGWFTTETSGGEIIDWKLLKRLADLRIGLSLDVYGNK
jgi:hypothetical protein